MQNRTKIRHLRLLRKIIDFMRFWEVFFTTFGSILASQSHPKSKLNLECSFQVFPGAARPRRDRGAAATLLRRQCSAGIFAADAPRRRPLSREKRLQPLRIAASRDCRTRFRTPRARGPAKFLTVHLKLLPNIVFARLCAFLATAVASSRCRVGGRTSSTAAC